MSFTLTERNRQLIAKTYNFKRRQDLYRHINRWVCPQDLDVVITTPNDEILATKAFDSTKILYNRIC